LLGGKPGGRGELILDNDALPNPKAQVDLSSQQVVHLNTPGGAGYGDPFSRDPERIREDVIAGYISPEAASADYGVVVRFMGGADEMVRLPEQWIIDETATRKIREIRTKAKGK
jgi:N-methylhydantoinase B